MSDIGGRDSLDHHPRNQSLLPESGVSSTCLVPETAAPGASWAAMNPITLPRIWDALKRYKWGVAIVSAVITVIALPLIWTLIIPVYTASAQVSVSPRVPRIVFKTDENGVVPLYKSYQNTQVSTILSPSVLERVLDRPDVQKTRWYKEGKGGLFSTPLPAVQRLRESLTVKPIPETELITVGMSSVDAGDAQLIANAVVDQYLDLVSESFDKTDRTRYQALSEELREIQSDIDSAIATNHAASKSLGTSEPEELRSQMTTQLSVLEAELRALERHRSLLEWERAQLPAADQSGETTADHSAWDNAHFQGNAEWRRLRTLADAARHRFDQAKERYGEAHPKLKEMEADWQYAEQVVRDHQDIIESQLFAMSSDESESGASVVGRSKESLDLQVLRTRKNEELLQQQIASQRAEVNRAGELAQQLAVSNERIKRKRELYDAIQARIQELDVERNAPARISIASYALKPALPARDRRILFSIMAVLAAIGSGCGLAIVRLSLDPSMRRADDVSAAVRIPFLGQLPIVTDSEALRNDSDESLHESLRMIRTALLERLQGAKGFTVLITSPTPETGKTTLASLLGRSLALLGKRVLLVDADLRRPALAERLGCNSDDGLTAILHEKGNAAKLIVHTKVPGLDILPAGRPIADNDPELLAAEPFKKAITEFRGKYDYILLDSPPVLSVADARILATLVEGAILVLKASHTRRDDASEALLRLTGSGCRLLGTVLVAAEPQPTYYGYSGAYGYSRRPKTELALTNA